MERRIVTVTWTNNPSNTPLPGVYVALDLVSRFANVDRHCGYLVLYQEPSGAAFQVMRREDNFLDNASATKIAQESSPEEVERAWAELSASCPGYQSVVDEAAQATEVAPSAPLPEASSSTIGFPSVDAALAALRSKTGVELSNQDGWTIANDAAEMTIWSFPPPEHAAYPSAVKRQIVERAGAINMEMNVLCEATKAACDDLVRAFQELNAQMRANMQGER